MKESSDTDSNKETADTKDKTETIPQYRTENSVTEHVFMVKHGQKLKQDVPHQWRDARSTNFSLNWLVDLGKSPLLL